MYDSNKFINADIEHIIRDVDICWEKFTGKTFLVTGATGLIGKLLVKSLLAYPNGNIRVIAVVRNREKANRIFEDCICDRLKFVISDIAELKHITEEVDYIVHAASQTSSKGFVSKPVETIKTTLEGTENVLEIARSKNVTALAFLSTMEVYGTPDTDEKITEEHTTNLLTTEVRNCYPISKRMAENLCVSYYKEYGVPVRILRLTQTFGPGVEYNDGRVFAEFGRCAVENRDIVLHTKGDTKRNYLYLSDAVTAILTVLAGGVSGEAYNAANEKTYCSIYEMACMVAEDTAENRISVKVEAEEDVSGYGYAKTLHMNLDTSKLRTLGWTPKVDLADMFQTLVSYLKDMKTEKEGSL